MNHALRTYTYPDGKVDLTSSSKANGPDQVGGLNLGLNRYYARLNGGAWAPLSTRSLHNAWTLAGAAETAAEAFEAITGD